jgi:hypothetical protein
MSLNSINQVSSPEKLLESIDFYLNIIGLGLFLIFFSIMLFKRRLKVDSAAIIICVVYALGTTA